MKKIRLMLFVLFVLILPAVSASDPKKDISLPPQEQESKIINKTLKIFTPEEHAEIQNKWLSVRYEHGIHLTDVFKWLLGVSGILGAVILAVIFWKRTLSRKITERKAVEKELQNSQNRYPILCSASFEGIIITDNGVIVEANTVVVQILGYTLPEIIGMEVTEIFAPKVRDDVRAKLLAGYEKMYESVGLTKGGVEFPVEIYAGMFTDKHRQVRCAAIRDLSERYKARDALRESEKKFRAVATGAQDAIIMTDGHRKITFWNKAAERIFQYSENEVMGKDPHEFIAALSFSKKFKEVYPRFQQSGKGDVIGRTIEFAALKKGGKEFPIEMSLSAIQIEGQWCAIAVIRDITERKKMEAELRRLATTDALTGVSNRRGFMEKAEHELRRVQRYGNPFTMIMVDIDHFKSINDNYGHQVGDLVLQKMALAIKSALRKSDIFGRIGGEEFSIVLMETEPDTAISISERIRSRIEALSIHTGKETVHITISIGLTFFREGDDISTVSKRSDEALYAAKENGRNCVVSL